MAAARGDCQVKFLTPLSCCSSGSLQLFITKHLFSSVCIRSHPHWAAPKTDRHLQHTQLKLSRLLFSIWSGMFEISGSSCALWLFRSMPSTDTGKSCFHWQPDRSPARGLWVLGESFPGCAPWWAQCELSHQLWMAQEGTNTHKESEGLLGFLWERNTLAPVQEVPLGCS